MMGYGGYGGMFMWLILLFIVGIGVYVVVNQGRRTGKWQGPASENPLDILKRRYAKGEISREEFDRQRKDLES